MISHKYRCIFLHVPKTGGTSIESALGHRDGHVGRGSQDHRSLRTLQNPLWDLHAFSSVDNLAEIARKIRYRFMAIENPDRHLFVSKQQYNEYFKFTVVRNPWARAYSYYMGVMRNEKNKQNLGITKEMSFEAFLTLFKRKRLIRPQTCWLKDYRGAIPLDFICRFENLQADFTEACRLMGLEPLELPHKIKGPGEDYRQAYDKLTIKLVAEAYSDEISLFKYKFGD